MTKLSIAMLSTFLLSTAVWASPAAQSTEINSFHKAVLEKAAQNNHSQVNTTPSAPYTHESEKNNSLPRAVLALQGTKMNLVLNSASDVSYSHDSDLNTSEQYNSLSHGALAK